mmetsp:Transcript_50782/g.99277  ORF Transcript_50782/g.99277 Transcript_50782/m.99277 type:complete len:146 (-) Transcript_50782:261-698(-)
MFSFRCRVYPSLYLAAIAYLSSSLLPVTYSFSLPMPLTARRTRSVRFLTTKTPLAAFRRNSSAEDPSAGKRISKSRREELGMEDEDDEYDLDTALNNNTDPFITKVIAGSLIVAILALLVVGVVVPSITDYGEGVCSPIQNGGRC